MLAPGRTQPLGLTPVLVALGALQIPAQPEQPLLEPPRLSVQRPDRVVGAAWRTH